MLDRINELPKLVEDILQTSINTGPRGAIRLVQGIQAVIGVGSEWLNDFSQVPCIHVLLFFHFIILIYFSLLQSFLQHMALTVSL